MQYYQKIDLDYLDEIKTISLTYIKTQDHIYTKNKKGAFHLLDINELLSLCPQINEAFKKYNLICNYAAAFVTYSSEEAPIHIDAYGKESRINIPLENCKGSVTKFYTGGEFEPWFNPNTNIRAFKYVKGAIFVDQVEIDQATVIRVRVPHSVQVDSSRELPRVTLTLGFNIDPTFLLEKPIIDKV